MTKNSLLTTGDVKEPARAFYEGPFFESSSFRVGLLPIALLALSMGIYLSLAYWGNMPALVRGFVVLGMSSLPLVWARAIIDHGRIQERLGETPSDPTSAKLLETAYLWTYMALDILSVVLVFFFWSLLIIFRHYESIVAAR